MNCRKLISVRFVSFRNVKIIGDIVVLMQVYISIPFKKGKKEEVGPVVLLKRFVDGKSSKTRVQTLIATISADFKTV